MSSCPNDRLNQAEMELDISLCDRVTSYKQACCNSQLPIQTVKAIATLFLR